jgi:hypothetical protein
MMEAARTSETLVNFYQTARCYNPEDSNLRKRSYLLCGVRQAKPNFISEDEDRANLRKAVNF